jgi:hypothetical protein
VGTTGRWAKANNESSKYEFQFLDTFAGRPVEVKVPEYEKLYNVAVGRCQTVSNLMSRTISLYMENYHFTDNLISRTQPPFMGNVTSNVMSSAQTFPRDQLIWKPSDLLATSPQPRRAATYSRCEA